MVMALTVFSAFLPLRIINIAITVSIGIGIIGASIAVAVLAQKLGTGRMNVFMCVVSSILFTSRYQASCSSIYEYSI